MAQKRKILIVEDDTGTRKLFSIVLGRMGYDIVETATGPGAINLAQVTQPDLIILDIELPWMSGDKVLEQIKADPATQHIPVIVTTAQDRDSLSVQGAVAAGATKVLYKPTSPKVLEDEVRRILLP